MVRTFAAIDVGSFELELGIYEISDKIGVRSVDHVKHVIALGRDTYNNGKISYHLVEEMCEVLADFVRIMKEYRVEEYRAYATSAMREAKNSQIVLDQIKVRTGIDVRIISNSEQRFISYKAIASKDAEFQKIIQKGTGIVDVGFGSMQVSLFDKDALVSTQNLPLGVLRIRELLAHEHLSREVEQILVTEMVDNELVTFRKMYLKDREIKTLIAIGEPVLMLHYKLDEMKGRDRVTVDEVNSLYNRLSHMTLDQIEDMFDVNAEYASMMFPTAAIYKRIMEMTGADNLWVPGIMMTDGIAADYAEAKKLLKFNHSFTNDIIVTSRNMAKRYKCHMPHVQVVEETSLKLFDSLKKYHGLKERERLLLQIAANLHSCGNFVTMRDATDCAYNLIMATEIIGLSHVEREVVANVVRYHVQPFRYNQVQVMAKPSIFTRLVNPDNLTLTIAKLIAILRLANSMDRSHKGKLAGCRLAVRGSELVITTDYTGDVTVEAMSIAEKGDFFEEIFGIRPVLKQKKEGVDMAEKETIGTDNNKTIYTDPKNYVNRELSWLEFDYRILNEARDKSIPLFERIKFLSITASNLDEFFMVRVASLKDMVHAKYKKPDIAGLKADEQLELIGEKTHDLVGLQYSTYNRSLVPALKQQGLNLICEHEELTEKQAEYVDRYFRENVYPVLTPMAVDSSRPFPLIRNKSLNIAALVQKKNGEGELEFAMVQVPAVLPRIVELPMEDAGVRRVRMREEEDGERRVECVEESRGMRHVILLEEIIERNIHTLFLNYNIVSAHPFRIMRNADFTLDEEEAVDLLEEIQKQLRKRQWGEVIRLEVEEKVDRRLLKILKKELEVGNEDIYEINGPLDLTFLMKMYGMGGFEDLKTPTYTPQPVPALMNDDDIFTNIRKGDIFLHHPYQTFDPVVNLVQKAAKDPNVLAIKQTLYRVSGHSPIVAALAEAAENGKQVSVLVELKARFDEENNINWAKKLEKAGCHVIYGLVGLKTHCKITLVVRREEDGIRRYVHLGTGNYNDSTARLYTDCGLMTCHPLIGEDATAVFNMLSGYSEPPTWNKLALAPLWLRSKCIKMIRRETKRAREGRPAHIMAKMNSLCDKEVIANLYEASCAGVKIELIIRGICCLKAGVPGLSENIAVHSIVGNFLEHARIFYFENGGSPEVYMGSADWMPRNLDKRVEIMFPVEDPELKKQVIHILEVQLADNVKAHILQPDGTYEKIDKRGKVLVAAQEQFCAEAIAAAKHQSESTDIHDTRVFVPAEPQE